MNTTGKGGFATCDKAEHIRLSRKGGQKHNPNKGFGSMERKLLKSQSRKWALKRWRGVVEDENV